ncbi:ABC transporter substrate-binding protein [Marinomonas sp.]|nr:ABC transporter substrate-binding protein [Marinomonas sp.]MDB4836844.1 ABC transporter substrate-binding protein [Marinomonas sp.]
MKYSACKTRSLVTGVVMTAMSATLLLSSANAFAFKETGKIIAGSDMTYAPYEYMDKGKPAGFDIEFLNGVAKEMGVEAENLDTRWANLIPGLQGGRYDIINSSMYITAERMKVIDMIPYLKSGQAIVAPTAKDFQPKVFEDLCGHKVGTMAGTAFLKQVQTISSGYCDVNNLGSIKISEYPTDPEATQAVLSGAVEVQVTDASIAKGVVKKLRGRIAVSSDTILFPVLNGFAVKKGNDDVRKALIEGIEKFSKTPEYTALLDKYNFQAPNAEDLKKLMP